jgi:glycosyltransferase involved in cell wall biosynthesis
MLQMEMGGAERLVYNLARKLDRNLFNPSIAWFFGDRILKEFKALDIPLYHIPKVKRVDFSAMRKLGEIIKNNNIHVVNAHHFMSMVYAFYGSKIKNRSKLIYTEHSESDIEQITWKWKKIGRYLLLRADASVGVSATVSRRIDKDFRTDHLKTFTIQNGVNLEAFANSNDKTAFRKELGLSTHDQIIGVVANFRKVKNHIFLLKAFSELIKEYRDVKLLLIGQGFTSDLENSEQEIRDFVKGKDLIKDVLLLGYRSDIPRLLRNIDVFCLTSFKEGLPISLLEAMATGLPAVGTDVEGIRDVIIPKKNGFLVSIDDVDGLKESLLVLLKDKTLRRNMGEESKSMAINNYSLDRCVQLYQDLFMTIVNSAAIK